MIIHQIRHCSTLQSFPLYGKGGPIPLFSDTFNSKYVAENFTTTDSNTNTNPYRHMVVIIIPLLLYKYMDKTFKW